MKNLKFGKEGFKSKKRELDEEKELFEKLREETDFERKDFWALTIAALVTLLPIALIVFLAVYFILELFFS